MAKIFIAGHRGMVGSAILRQLTDEGHEIVTARRDELDLTHQGDVYEFFQAHKFDQVYLAAAKVGGIHANNTYPADFIYQNLLIQNNVIHSAYRSGVMKLLFLGSSCIYPKLANQPIRESELLSGYLEPTNEPYAIAKIAGIKLCESYNRQYGTDYRCVMPPNLYGENDNYHGLNSHVIPALIKKIHSAMLDKSDSVEVWGTGKPLREFMHVDDMASGSIFVMKLERDEFYKTECQKDTLINVGSGNEISITDLAYLIKKIVKFDGKIIFNDEKPDGAMRKIMSNERIKAFGWQPKIDLEVGINMTYSSYLNGVIKDGN